MHKLQKEMWSDEATVTSEQDFFIWNITVHQLMVLETHRN